MKWEFPTVRDCSRNTTFSFYFDKTRTKLQKKPYKPAADTGSQHHQQTCFHCLGGLNLARHFHIHQMEWSVPAAAPCKADSPPTVVYITLWGISSIYRWSFISSVTGTSAALWNLPGTKLHSWFSGWVTTDRKILPILSATFKALLKQYFLYYYLGLILFWICSFGVHFKALNYTLRRNSLIVEVIFSSTLEERIVHGSVNTTVWKVMSYQTKLNWLTDITCNEWVLDSLS